MIDNEIYIRKYEINIGQLTSQIVHILKIIVHNNNNNKTIINL